MKLVHGHDNYDVKLSNVTQIVYVHQGINMVQHQHAGMVTDAVATTVRLHVEDTNVKNTMA